MKGFIRHIIILLVLCSTISYAKNITISQLLVPDFVKAQVVTDNMNMNGTDMIIIQFYTLESFEKIESFYRKSVKEIKISEVGEWKIISWMDKKKLNTVQVAYNPLEKAHHGFIAISNLPIALKENIVLGKKFPSLKNSVFQNDIKANDLNKKSRTIWLTNKNSVKDNINFYKNYYVKQGWKVEQVSFDSTNGNAAMMLGKQGDEVNLTVSRAEGKSNVVAVVVNK